MPPSLSTNAPAVVPPTGSAGPAGAAAGDPPPAARPAPRAPVPYRSAEPTAEATASLKLVAALRATSGVLGLAGAVVGVLVIVGWVADLGRLKTVSPGLVAMNPLTAVCFALTGVAVWLRRAGRGVTARRVATALALVVLAFAALRAIACVSAFHLDVDLLLFRRPVEAEHARMVPFSGAIFLLLSAALLLLDVRLRAPRAVRGTSAPVVQLPASGASGIWPAQWLALAAGFCSLLSVCGYLYSFTSESGLSTFRAMALHSCITFLLLSLAALFLRPDRGLMAIATSDTPDGVMARRLLPAAVLLPVLVGWLQEYGEQRGWYEHQIGSALLVAASGFLFTTLVWWNLSALHRVDLHRQRIEEGLREAEAVYHSLVETLPQNIYRKDLAGRFTFANRNFCNTVGQTRERLVGSTDLDFFPEALANRYRNDDRKVIETGQTLDLVEEHIKPDGSKLYVQVMKTPVIGPDGDIIGTQGIFWDVTDRKLAEQELERKNIQLEEAARSERQALQALRRAHEELKTTQIHLVQSEKLVGLGQMVAGVAHEINNPLAFVTNNVVVLQRDVSAIADLLGLYRKSDPLLAQRQPELAAEIEDLIDRVDLGYTIENLTELLTRSREGLKRIQQIVKDLRDFARLDESDWHEVDLNAGIESTVNIILGHAKKKRVTVEKQLSPLPSVACFPAKINQVVMNLLANAIDASPEGGKVIARTTHLPAVAVPPGASAPEAATAEAAAGPRLPAVRIEVIDHGTGIPPAIRQRIFDPFFTTKPPGKGTGLGLSISYGIVQDHGGTINVESEPGKGTTFTVTLPVQGKPGAGEKRGDVGSGGVGR